MLPHLDRCKRKSWKRSIIEKRTVQLYRKMLLPEVKSIITRSQIISKSLSSSQNSNCIENIVTIKVKIYRKVLLPEDKLY